jgi:hypothetical protein
MNKVVERPLSEIGMTGSGRRQPLSFSLFLEFECLHCGKADTRFDANDSYCGKCGVNPGFLPTRKFMDF